MENLTLFRTALAISSGTMSYLIGCTRYAEIDRVQRLFANYCLVHPDHSTWVRAWHSFECIGWQ